MRRSPPMRWSDFWSAVVLSLFLLQSCSCLRQEEASVLRFRADGEFKILQIADMHYANGASTKCKDVLPTEWNSCSDLNTTAFVKRLIEAEQPDLIVFSGDNIYGQDTQDPVASLNSAFAPAIDAKIPWAAILGNHDQESSLSRQQVMEHIAKMDYTLSQVYPGGNSSVQIDGFGNYHLEVGGAMGSELEVKSVMNIYMLDSGDYSQVKGINGYGWIQESQKRWFKGLSTKLKEAYRSEPIAQSGMAPALVYFHIPLVETLHVATCSIVGVKQEGIGCAEVNSEFLATMQEASDVRAVFIGHDHVNDFCGDLTNNIKVCYGGGVGYHAYGKAGWSRRARVVVASLHPSVLTSVASLQKANDSALVSQEPQGLGVHQIKTWKRLDDHALSIIDQEIIWSNLSPHLLERRRWALDISSSLLLLISFYLILSLLFSYSMSWWPFSKQFRIPFERNFSSSPLLMM